MTFRKKVNPHEARKFFYRHIPSDVVVVVRIYNGITIVKVHVVYIDRQ